MVAAAGDGCEDVAGSGVGATLRASATTAGELEELEDVVVLEDEDDEEDEEEEDEDEDEDDV